MNQLLTTGHPHTWSGYLFAHLAAYPFAMILVVMTLAIMLQGAGLRPGAPRPIARRFLTNREQAMLVKLERVLPHCRIHAQVAMGALLAAPDSPFRRRRLSDRNAFSQKIVDFVAQDRASGAIVALIEVDDWSHVLARDMARDAMTEHVGGLREDRGHAHGAEKRGVASLFHHVPHSEFPSMEMRLARAHQKVTLPEI